MRGFRGQHSASEGKGFLGFGQPARPEAQSTATGEGTANLVRAASLSKTQDIAERMKGKATSITQPK